MKSNQTNLSCAAAVCLEPYLMCAFVVPVYGKHLEVRANVMQHVKLHNKHDFITHSIKHILAFWIKELCFE